MNFSANLKADEIIVRTGLKK